MKYIIIGFEGFIFSIADHLQKEGKEVITSQITTSLQKEDSTNKKRRLKTYDNICKKIPFTSLLKELRKIRDHHNYFVICESNNIFAYAQELQDLGFHGIFPTEENRSFEIDRNFAKRFVKRYYPNLKVAENIPFTSVFKAKQFLKSSKKLWVLKSQVDEVATVVPTTNDWLIAQKQLIENFEIYKDEYESKGFLLEEKIPDVIELTPEKLYYDGKPLGMSIMFENKYIGSGNLSYQIGCAGDIVFPVSMESNVHDICFPPIVDEMAKQHKGLFIWDASLLIDSRSHEIYFGEFCPNRFGFNSFLTTLAQMPSIDYFFSQVVAGKNPFTPHTIASSLTVFNLLNEPTKNYPLADILVDFPSEEDKNIWMFDIYKNKNDKNIYTTGFDKTLGAITGSKTSLTESVDVMYSSLDKFAMNNVYYRPKFDFMSKDYPTSILNRLAYCIQHKLFPLPFPM